MGDELRAEQERHAERIYDALRPVVVDRFDQQEGAAIFSRFVLVVEFVTPDGDAYLRKWRQASMREWDEHGMLHDALFYPGDDPEDDDG